ncbi:MAG TPA: 50S ribosomal protein L5 [Candidatus Saccharimonadia bacterium]|nr:50S ribosomal protein L5 [Candidatus Saccharimonadia bacterium]
MNRLKQQYIEKVLPVLKAELKLTNNLAVPSLEKIVVSVGVGNDESNHEKAMENVSEQLKVMTGHKPRVTKAKQAIAGFKLRAGDPVGLFVTLRGEFMWEFLDKLNSIVLPRVKDFQGIKKTAFDKQGNYNLGVAEQIVFPEIEYDKIDRIRGLQITVVTTAKNPKDSKRLLELLGMPFEKDEK